MILTALALLVAQPVAQLDYRACSTAPYPQQCLAEVRRDRRIARPCGADGAASYGEVVRNARSTMQVACNGPRRHPVAVTPPPGWDLSTPYARSFSKDVCTERDELASDRACYAAYLRALREEGARAAAEHRRIICEGVLLPEVDRDDPLGLTCRRVLCEANGDDGLTDSLREHGECAMLSTRRRL